MGTQASNTGQVLEYRVKHLGSMLVFLFLSTCVASLIGLRNASADPDFFREMLLFVSMLQGFVIILLIFGYRYLKPQLVRIDHGTRSITLINCPSRNPLWSFFKRSEHDILFEEVIKLDHNDNLVTEQGRFRLGKFIFNGAEMQGVLASIARDGADSAPRVPWKFFLVIAVIVLGLLGFFFLQLESIFNSVS